jgi:hypothetical protein
MPQSNPLNSAFRQILKLKTAPRKSPRDSDSPHEISSAALSPSLSHPATKTQPPPRPQSKLAQKPGASWSDEFKRRMQADMDALTR